ncbi:MAG: dTDP-4-dehydrorhamnose 3,5-epimerase family protein [Spirochaetes bacterium]|nr:dTDP-4-dehydrorhamnose 3,5-epimerase family protein [Spirochaetota bacterium]
MEEKTLDIPGVILKTLSTHGGEGGFFRELIRGSDPFFQEGFGQFSHSLVLQGVAKGWHLHQKQVDWWYVAAGVLKVALCDRRPGAPKKVVELILGDHQTPRVLRIPPGVAHGCKALQGPVHLFYITSREYDPGDEGRLPHDDPSIGYDWTRGVPID